MRKNIRYEIENGVKVGETLVITDKEHRIINPKTNGKTSIVRVELTCSVCGHKIYAAPSLVKVGRYTRCPKCVENRINSAIPKGTRFGSLTVMDNVPVQKYIPSGNKILFYKCKCDCGNETMVSKSNLTSGSIKSCGCGKVKYIQPKEGMKMGRLTIKKDLGFNTDTHRHEYVCDCECGRKDVVIHHGVLTRNPNPNCGCLSRYGAIRLRQEHPELIPHLDRAKAILDRCRVTQSGAFHNYGGRGIKCTLGDIQTVVAYNISKVPGYDSTLNQDLDRIDNNGDYTIDHPVHGREVWYYHDPNDGKTYPALGNLRWCSRITNDANKGEITVESISNKLMTENSFKIRINYLGLDADDFVKTEAPFANKPRYANRTIGDQEIFLFTPKEMSEEERTGIYNKIKSYYDYWDDYRENSSYNYDISYE